MIRRLPVVLIAITLTGAAQSATAADALSSSYWDAAYVNETVESGSGTDQTPEGFRLGLGLGLAKFLSFTADYDQIKYINNRTREGFGSAGIMYHTQDPAWQVHGGVTYERYEFDDNTNSARDSEEEGYGVELGGRYALDNLELHAAYRYLDFGDLDRTKVGFKGARYGLGADVQLCPWWSLVADYRWRQHKFDISGPGSKVDYSEWTVGFRRYFATDPDRKNRHGGLLNGLFSGE